MCPSYKATGDLRYSPKGRADLLREWLRLKAQDDASLKHFERETFPVMDGCLSCKACSSTCPVHIDIPELKSLFLENYHKKNIRPLRDYIFSYLEKCSFAISKHPAIANLIMGNTLSKYISEYLGILMLRRLQFHQFIIGF